MEEPITGPAPILESAAAVKGPGTPLPESPQEPLPVATMAAAAAPQGPVADLARQLGALADQQEQLRDLFESRLRADEVQSAAIDRLHEQLQDYKANFIRQALLPILKDVIYCFDFVDGEAGRLANQEAPLTPEALAKTFAHLKHMLLDTLFKYDIEPYRSEDVYFDRKTQQCVKTLPTEREDEDRKVAAAGVMGFREREAVLRKEQVTVYKYTQAGR